MIRITAVLCLLAAPLGAHPHIFVNAGIEVIVSPGGELTHLRVTWEYDELYTLLITEDYGVDQDFDGVLSVADREIITGFDMNWVDGFNGDLVASLAEVPLDLSGPYEATTDLVQGKLVTTHLREVSGRPVLGAAALSLKPYDATYYTAYEVQLPVQVTGRTGCNVETTRPDIEGALAETQAALSAIPADDDVEAMGFPEVGAKFATEIRITCPDAS